VSRVQQRLERDSRDDLVSTLVEFSRNLERFDSMMRNGRHLLSLYGADDVALDDRLIRRQLRRMTTAAGEIAARTHSLLGELRGNADFHVEGATPGQRSIAR